MRHLLIATTLAVGSALCIAPAEAEQKQKRVTAQKESKQKASDSRQQQRRRDNYDPDVHIRHELIRDPGNAVD